MKIAGLKAETEEKQGRQLASVPIAAMLLSVLLLGSVVYKTFNLGLFGFSFKGAAYLLFLIALFLPLVFIWFPAGKSKKARTVPFYDWILAAISFAIPFYLSLHALDIQNLGWSSGMAPVGVQVICLIFLVPVFEGTRRVGGASLAVICLFFASYPLFAEHMPGLIGGISFPFWRTVTLHVMGGDSMLGMVMDVVGNVVIGYLLFGVAFSVTGGGSFFIKLAMSILGKYRGGTAKVSILSSAFFGSISGSVVANVIGTGVVTIPSMKKSGYPAHYAAAVEACASTGGTLMPPVMGSSAFFCAQFLGVPYYKVALAAFIPSLLYYTGLFFQIDGYAAKVGMKGMTKEELPSLRETMKEGWIYLVALAVLIFFIFNRQEARAPFYCTAALFVFLAFDKKTRLGLGGYKKILLDSGKSIAQICAILLGVGFIVGSLSMTGVAHSFSFDVVALAGNNLALLLILGAGASFILGMGMVSSAAYLFLALILAPALIHAGVVPMAAHMFVMYCGMISFITPPVALGSIAAAGLADCSAMKTGFKSMQLGMAIYFVPFALALNPALIGYGKAYIVAASICANILGIFLLSGALESCLFFVGYIRAGWRILFAASGLLLMCPSWQLAAIGAALGVVVCIVCRKENKSGIAREKILR